MKLAIRGNRTQEHSPAMTLWEINDDHGSD
jgi:hypothetical protein